MSTSDKSREFSFFQEFMGEALAKIKIENAELHKRKDHFPLESFEKISQYLGELEDVANNLEFPLLRNCFGNIKEVVYYCTLVENPRAHKKVAVLSLDFESTLGDLKDSLSDRDKLKGVLKTLEVQVNKVNRLKRGEFYSISQAKAS